MQSVNCPYCNAKVLNDGTLAGQMVACPTCGRQFTTPIQGPVAPPLASETAVPPPPPMQGATAAQPFVQKKPRTPHQYNTPRLKRALMKYPMILYGIIGASAGCVVGYFAAHHFAFYGGFALIGEPYSPARSSLVPGHMLLCGVLLGAIGVLSGFIQNWE